MNVSRGSDRVTIITITESLIKTFSMVFEVEPKNWYRDEFLVSTEQRLLQIDAVHEAMDSDVMWWTRALPRDALLQALQNSLCLGLYELPQSTSQIAGRLLSSSFLLALRLRASLIVHNSRSERPEANRASEGYHRWRDVRVSHRRVRTTRIPGQRFGALVDGMSE